MTKKCICNRCPRRFICFTHAKVFSDPLLQNMFESYIGEGVSIEDALFNVREEIQRQLDKHARESILNVNNAVNMIKAEKNPGGSHGSRGARRGKRGQW